MYFFIFCIYNKKTSQDSRFFFFFHRSYKKQDLDRSVARNWNCMIPHGKRVCFGDYSRWSEFSRLAEQRLAVMLVTKHQVSAIHLKCDGACLEFDRTGFSPIC